VAALQHDTLDRQLPDFSRRLNPSADRRPKTPLFASTRTTVRVTSIDGSSPDGSVLDVRRDHPCWPLASLCTRPAMAEHSASSRSDRPRPDDGVNAWSPQNSSGVRSVPFRGGGDRRRRSALDDLRRRPDEIGGSLDEPHRVGAQRPQPERRATTGHTSTTPGTAFDNPCQHDPIRSCSSDKT